LAFNKVVSLPKEIRKCYFLVWLVLLLLYHWLSFFKSIYMAFLNFFIKAPVSWFKVMNGHKS
jgi:hypothetical protein